jgi:hypothetical protein
LRPPHPASIAVGVADVVVSDLDLEIATEELTRLATEASSQGVGQISLDGGVRAGSAGHGDRGDAIEFVA